MDLNRISVGLIVLLAVLGVTCGIISNNNVAYGAETWITPNNVSVYMTDLASVITVKIKNNKDHVQYFKISQKYTANLNGSINWVIDWTDPQALKMIDAVSPELGGDYGWKIQPGETKTVSFKLRAIGNSTDQPLIFAILNQASQPNIYWPLIPDPGLGSSWFQPNEIEMLNPDLDLQYWRGKFCLLVVNKDAHAVSGIIRAPIVPVDSKLVYSNPKVTFLDKDFVLNGKVAAWDLNLAAGGSQGITYIYQWPSDSSSSSVTGKASSSIPKTSAASTPSVPTKETGLPYGLFVIGGVLTAGGLVYARFMR